MGTGKRPKAAHGTKPAIHASHLPVANGGKEFGWKAGALHGVNGHRTFAHQPCLKDYTDGALVCPYCEAGAELTWRGYLPVWDRDWALRYVLIGKDVEESVECIERGDQITVSRAKSSRAPLIVRAEVNMVRSLPDKAPWTQPVNMEDICLLLWKLPVLALWVRGARGKSDNAVSLPTAPKKEPKQSNGKPFSPEYRNAAMKYTPPETVAAEEAVAAAERAILANHVAASKNGHAGGKKGS